MKKLLILTIALCVGCSSTAFSRGGGMGGGASEASNTGGLA